MADQGTLHGQNAVHGILAGIQGAASGFFRGAARTIDTVVRAMQYSRMVSVLNARSDRQLEEMGITRGDIPQHAAYLLDYEYDGL
ncbi:hypothetical protein FIU94_13310 [Sulfitobacter sp. THAF37]|uniref:DUF1127 domain-containing protein n=1 Tax=Sulfitobacter sp. THAF37 TaxID=2587855 RepID=UPI0012689378|nr:DUF1127 domain-containing protein [Sulfitobacter sp. THAF37]QFT59805.1 hypothetical protein FIU94_13310 [Sulfitobacter sp. THAF37]